MANNNCSEEKWNALFEDLNEYTKGRYEGDINQRDKGNHNCSPRPCPRPCPKPCPRPALRVNGIQTLLTNGTTVANNSPVIFNQTIITVGPNITYDNLGTFIIAKPGIYSITWWVTGSVPSGTDSIDFAIRTTNALPPQVPGSFPIPAIAAGLPVQVDGNALINVLSPTSLIQLVNISGATVTYATTVAAQASIVITEVTA